MVNLKLSAHAFFFLFFTNLLSVSIVLAQDEQFDLLAEQAGQAGAGASAKPQRTANKAEMNELADKMSAMLGIPESSRLYRPFRRHFDLTAPRKKLTDPKEKKTKQEQMRKAWTTDASLLPFKKNLPILLHYRGRFGIDIPAEADVWRPGKELGVEGFKEKLAALVPELQKIAKEELTAEPLPRCEESKTERARLSKGKISKAEKDDQILDILFINKSDVPLDYEEAFGKRVVLRTYKPGSSQDAMSYYIKKLGVKCLPYRMRATKEFRFEDWGSNALRNYDSDPSGKGELNPIAERSLQNFGYEVKRK